MPAGWPYFAWIDVGETVFTAGHMRWDEDVFSFTLKQEEGDPASLTVVVRRPKNEYGDPIGLLGPGRKIWAWFALDCGPALVKFRGRLVGIPTSIFEDLVTLEFVARPGDIVAQKAALADSLRVLPFYDVAVIDEQRRDDPDVVLEGYTKIWHYNPETHVLTASDEILGEDGIVEFDGVSEDGKSLYDRLGLTLTSGPLARVDIIAEYNWTQQATGDVDLSDDVTAGLPIGPGGGVQMNAADWPQAGTSLGDGWEVKESGAKELYEYEVQTTSHTEEFLVKFSESDVARATINESISYIGEYPIPFSPQDTNWIITNESYSSTFRGPPSISHSLSAIRHAVFVQEIVGPNGGAPTLVASYGADRDCTERVLLTMFADVQPIMTAPEDGEALLIDDIRSVNLSEPIDGELLIGDVARRSYIATARGNQSLEHLLALGRAHLMRRARAVEITFAPKLSRMPEITLRKSATFSDPRVGVALGKIIAYSIALDGQDGRINCEVRIGCPIGRGGSAVAADGSPTYCSADYTGPDYQQFIDRVVLAAFPDESIGYTPPNADPDDDGLNLLSTISSADAFEVAVSHTSGSPSSSSGSIPTNSGGTFGSFGQANISELLSARDKWLNERYAEYNTQTTFKLKSMNNSFTTEYVLTATPLKIPMGYNLETV